MISADRFEAFLKSQKDERFIRIHNDTFKIDNKDFKCQKIKFFIDWDKSSEAKIYKRIMSHFDFDEKVLYWKIIPAATYSLNANSSHFLELHLGFFEYEVSRTKIFREITNLFDVIIRVKREKQFIAATLGNIIL